MKIEMEIACTEPGCIMTEWRDVSGRRDEDVADLVALFVCREHREPCLDSEEVD